MEFDVLKRMKLVLKVRLWSYSPKLKPSSNFRWL